MTTPKRLVLFVEGTGDKKAMPVLIKRMLSERSDPPWDAIYLDDKPPFEVGEISCLVGRDKDTNELHCREWERLLQQALRTRKNLGAVLLVLDGDIDPVAGEPFCRVTFGRILATAARDVGGGSLFSAAVVFLVPEYEVLFIASHESLPGLKQGATPPPDIEAKKGAKGWLGQNLTDGYKPIPNQEELTSHIDFDLVRPRLPSFRRLEHALDELVTAVRNGTHVATPPLPPPSDAAATES